MCLNVSLSAAFQQSHKDTQMSTEYGCKRTFGNTTYGVSGCDSADEALERVYRRAFENGDWRPRDLREKWWQFWRPVEHTELEQKFKD